jgi:hypothetical protein
MYSKQNIREPFLVKKVPGPSKKLLALSQAHSLSEKYGLGRILKALGKGPTRQTRGYKKSFPDLLSLNANLYEV